MKVKVVFHIGMEEELRLNMALNNMANLLKEIHQEDSEICLVANGHGVKLFQKDYLSDYANKIDELSKAGVRFLVCSNSLAKFDIDKEELLESCEVLPVGILELVRLQQEGFAYIKP